MSKIHSLVASLALLGILGSCELNLHRGDAPVLALENPWRDAKMKAAAKERIDKLKKESKEKAQSRTLDVVITITDEQTACEKDMLDPKTEECYKNESQSDCEASKLCFWNYTRTKRDATGLLIPNPSCWPAIQDECVAIDIGCCEGEKRRAVNKKSLGALNDARKQGCLALKDNPGLCRGRSFYHYKYEESPKCRNKVCTLQ